MRFLRALLGVRIPSYKVGLFFDTLAGLLSSGMLVQEALRRASQFSDPELRSICEHAAQRVATGMPLHQALTPWKHRLPEIVVPVLEVAQVSGTLESAARRLGDAFSAADAFERDFRYTVFDQRLVIVLVALGMGVLAGIYYFSHAIAPVLCLVLLPAALLIGRLFLRWLFRWPAVRVAADTIKLAVPHMGLVARDLAAARWARSFTTLWHAGVPISYALEVSSRSALNAHFEHELLRSAKETRAGRSLSESLAATQLLPSHLVDIVAISETSGRFGASLDRFADILEAQALVAARQELISIVVAVSTVIVAVAAIGLALYAAVR